MKRIGRSRLTLSLRVGISYSFVCVSELCSCVNVRQRATSSSSPLIKAAGECERVCSLCVGLCCSVHVQQWQMAVKPWIVGYLEDYIAGSFFCLLLQWPASTPTTSWLYRASHDCFIIIYCRDPVTSHRTLQEIRPPLFRSWPLEWNGGGVAQWERFMWLLRLIYMWAKAIYSRCILHELAWCRMTYLSIQSPVSLCNVFTEFEFLQTEHNFKAFWEICKALENIVMCFSYIAYGWLSELKESLRLLL